MRFSHITIALCAALLSPGSTLGHESHSDEGFSHGLTVNGTNSSAEGWVYSDDSAEQTSSPEFPLPMNPSAITGPALSLPTTQVDIHNHSSVYLDTIVGSSTRGSGFNDSGSMTGFATYTATPSTEDNRTSNTTKPTMSALPIDTSDAAVFTTPVFAVLIAFIFAALVAVEI
ncbi:hypothetical protein Q9L58_006117 [Maublancomyces gigas]|uniref:Uncharacterized protein n=1 Tax=Discina gigas TaxID=1032678 RepID=A0ABR3GGE4_9PEZI